MKVSVIHGPNMNMLGIREPEVYGKHTYEDLIDFIKEQCAENGMEATFYQSNHEGDLIDKIHEAYFKNVDAIIINAGAYTHTSIAIHDAIVAVGIPTIEVHISNIAAREDFRKDSFLADVCVRSYVGFGFEGYAKAVKHLKKKYYKD